MSVVNALVEIFQESGFLSLEWQNWVMIAVSFLLLYFAIVKKYLENGANVAIAGSRQATVEKAIEKLPEYKDRVMGIWPDLCSPEEVAAAFSSVKEKFGSLDILANNAEEEKESREDADEGNTGEGYTDEGNTGEESDTEEDGDSEKIFSDKPLFEEEEH